MPEKSVEERIAVRDNGFVVRFKITREIISKSFPSRATISRVYPEKE